MTLASLAIIAIVSIVLAACTTEAEPQPLSDDWAESSPTPAIRATVPRSAATAARADTPSREGCSPSYPTVCIPPAPPDLDCKDITFRRFQVIPPDPHGFDANDDGVGCET